VVVPVGLVLGMAPALGVNPYRERVRTHLTFSVPDGCIRALIGSGSLTCM